MNRLEQWRRRIEEQKRSGMSIAAWCKREGIRDNQFHYWREQVRGGGGGADEGRFMRVGSAEVVELIVGDKVRLKIPANFDVAQVKRLLEALGC